MKLYLIWFRDNNDPEWRFFDVTQHQENIKDYKQFGIPMQITEIEVEVPENE